jgi:hypothetical protein
VRFSKEKMIFPMFGCLWREPLLQQTFFRCSFHRRNESFPIAPY